MLLNHGTNINLKNNKNESVFEIASGNTLQILHKHKKKLDKMHKNYEKIFGEINFQSSRMLYHPYNIRPSLLALKYKNNINYIESTKNTKKLLLCYFNISDSELFNDKISDILKWLQ